MGRAIVRRSKLFLFDEPLSNLDPALRTQVRVDIRKQHDRLGATSIYVTHDQVEAMTMGDRVAVIKDGYHGDTSKMFCIGQGGHWSTFVTRGQEIRDLDMS